MYVLYYGAFFVYVGKATGIRNRLTQHYNGPHNRRLSIWISALDGDINFTYVTCNKEDLDDLEKSLIIYLQPVANIDRFVGYEPKQIEWRDNNG